MKEGSKKDRAEDRKLAKKHGMSMKQWERSAADKRHDAPKKGGKGGVKIASRVGGLPGTAGVKERKETSRAQRVARMEKSDRAV